MFWLTPVMDRLDRIDLMWIWIRPCLLHVHWVTSSQGFPLFANTNVWVCFLYLSVYVCLRLYSLLIHHGVLTLAHFSPLTSLRSVDLSSLCLCEWGSAVSSQVIMRRVTQFLLYKKKYLTLMCLTFTGRKTKREVVKREIKCSRKRKGRRQFDIFDLKLRQI